MKLINCTLTLKSNLPEASLPTHIANSRLATPSHPEYAQVPYWSLYDDTGFAYGTFSAQELIDIATHLAARAVRRFIAYARLTTRYRRRFVVTVTAHNSANDTYTVRISDSVDNTLDTLVVRIDGTPYGDLIDIVEDHRDDYFAMPVTITRALRWRIYSAVCAYAQEHS